MIAFYVAIEVCQL